MNPFQPLWETAEPLPLSRLLPPLHALIGAMDEFVFSGELDALASDARSCDEMFHGRELESALREVLEACGSGHHGYRESTLLESGVCLDLKNLLCPVLVYWSWVGHTCDPGGTDGRWCEMFLDLFSSARLEARRYAAVLETGRWEAAGE